MQRQNNPQGQEETEVQHVGSVNMMPHAETTRPRRRSSSAANSFSRYAYLASSNSSQSFSPRVGGSERATTSPTAATRETSALASTTPRRRGGGGGALSRIGRSMSSSRLNARQQKQPRQLLAARTLPSPTPVSHHLHPPSFWRRNLSSWHAVPSPRNKAETRSRDQQRQQRSQTNPPFADVSDENSSSKGNLPSTMIRSSPRQGSTSRMQSLSVAKNCSKTFDNEDDGTIGHHGKEEIPSLLHARRSLRSTSTETSYVENHDSPTRFSFPSLDLNTSTSDGRNLESFGSGSGDGTNSFTRSDGKLDDEESASAEDQTTEGTNSLTSMEGPRPPPRQPAPPDSPNAPYSTTGGTHLTQGTSLSADGGKIHMCESQESDNRDQRSPLPKHYSRRPPPLVRAFYRNNGVSKFLDLRRQNGNGDSLLPTSPAASGPLQNESLLSEPSISQEEPSEEVAEPTKLHQLCAQNFGSIAHLCQEGSARLSIEAAMSTNRFGQTPLHILSENHHWSHEAVLTVWAATNTEGIHIRRPSTPSSKERVWDEGIQHNPSITTSVRESEQTLMSFVVDGLFQAFPGAITTPDANNDIPFESALRAWVHQMHARDIPRDDGANNNSRSDTTSSFRRGYRSSSLRGSRLAHASRWRSNWSSFLFKSKNETVSVDNDRSQNHITLDSTDLPVQPPRQDQQEDQFLVEDGGRVHHSLLPTKDQGCDRMFPNGVDLTPHAMFAFQLLSALLDHMHHKRRRNAAAIAARNRRLRHSEVFLQGESNTDNRNIAALRPGKKQAEEDNSLNSSPTEDAWDPTCLEDWSSQVVDTIASIPDLVKTVLLLEDEVERNWCLSSTLMRQVLTNKYSVGGWLTGMLQCSEPRVSDRVMEYLHLVSSLPAEDETFPEIRSKSDNANAKRNLAAQDQLHQAVSRLDDFVPSLLALGEKQIEEVATTPLVRKVLDHIMARPFAVTVVFCDALFLAILILGFRGVVHSLLLGYGMSRVINYVYVTNTGVFYFVIRELGKAVSLCMVTHRTRVYFLSFWNLTDMLSTVLSLVSTIAVRYAFLSAQDAEAEKRRSDEWEEPLRNLLAVTTAFLWLRVLSYLKGINMQLATFVLAIIQITRDILWFCAILLTLVICFAQIFFTLLVPATCKEADTRLDRECSQPEYLISVYAMMLGDFGLFERDSFTSAFSVFLAVVYTFMVSIVLFNVLIAVASDSYEKCLIRSQGLFGRTRVMMVGELVCFQSLLRRNTQGGDTWTAFQDILFKAWWSHDSVGGWSRGSVIFFGMSFLVILIWILGETGGYMVGAKLGNIYMNLGSLLINVVLYLGIVAFLSVGAAETRSDGKEDSRTIYSKPSSVMASAGTSNYCFGESASRCLQSFMLRLLGSSSGDSKFGDNHEWRGKLAFLKKEMQGLSKSLTEQCKEQLTLLEPMLQRSEARLRDEILVVEENLLRRLAAAVPAAGTSWDGNHHGEDDESVGDEEFHEEM